MTTTVEQDMSTAMREVEAARDIDLKVYGIEHDAKRRIRVLRIFGVDPGTKTDFGESDLGTLAEYLEDPAGKYFCFSVGDLDRIVAGEIDQNDHDPAEDEHMWMNDILERLNWWKLIALAVLDAASDRGTEKQRSEILSLFADVLSAYTPALKSGYFFDRDYEDKGPRLELLRRYRLFTRYVGTFAREVWPEVNLDKLLQRA